MKYRNDLTAEYVNSILDYEPKTGELVWKVTRNNFAKAGSKAGWMKTDGYICVTINKKSYLVHRIAWLIMNGEWPEYSIDHVNGNKADNRILNLRSCNQSQNLGNMPPYKNNASGYKGITWYKNYNKWLVRIGGDKNNSRFVGYFNTLEDAIKARQKAEEKHFGEFAY